MKLTGILLLAGFLQVSAAGYSQRITLSEKNAPLTKIFKEIEKQSGLVFFYDNALLEKANNKVNIELKEVPLAKALEICFKDQPLTYAVVGKTIVITSKGNTRTTRESHDADTTIPVHGVVLNEKGMPVGGVTVSVKGKNKATSTDSNGEFILLGVDKNASLLFSSVNMESLERKVNGQTEMTVKLTTRVTTLNNVTVTANTGYQRLPKERATGSFEIINNTLFNRVTGPTVLPRLEGVVPGLLFDKRTSGEASLSGLTIRGVSTLTDGLTSPLIILDNFPYEGDVNNINPNDVENVTILKDAAAASIWGARAGNGVIVITTKKGRYDKRPQVSFNSNLTVIKKPDLFYFKQMNTSDYIDVEKMLFENGAYEGKISDNYTWPYLSPVVELLLQARNGTISQEAANAQIDILRKYDVRNDFMKYVYRKAVNQQYALSVSGGGEQFNYMFSGGYDNNRSSIVRTGNDRISLRSEFSYKPIRNLEIQAGLMYIEKNNQGLGSSSSLAYSEGMLPYTRLADDNGNPLVVGIGHRSGFIDTIGGGRLLDWKYRPLAELDASSNRTKTNDLLLNAGARYQLTSIFSTDIKYQYTQTTIDGRNWEGPGSYYTRNLINLVSQLDGTDVVRPIPLGGILSQSTGSASTYNLRGQLNANKSWNNKNELTAIAGVELRESRSQSHSANVYGYDENVINYKNVDFVDQFPTLFYDRIFIPSGIGFTDQIYRFTSIYANASYTYNNRYIISASARKDASNLFGVNANQRGVPLWSAGLSWDASKESFYKLDILPYLRLRATYGYQGNTNNNLSAYSVIQYLTDPNMYNRLAVAYIKNPANSSLRWEKVGTMNLGLDFGFKNNRLSGSFEYYSKHTKDALTLMPLDLTTGFNVGTFNNAALNGKGIDLQLHSLNLKGELKWNTDFIFSYVTNKVSKYVPVGTLSSSDVIKNGYNITPIEGKPAYTIFSYKWAGLDPQTGDPRGYINGQISKDYAALIQANVNDLEYNGSAVPVYFGSFRNTFTWRNINISANIIYKLGYYFRRTSINYSSLFNSGQDNGIGHADFSQRWQKPGDEKHTDVPSMIYPSDNLRDQFYTNSAALVSKADHIRFQDITLGYTIDKSNWYFKNIRLYANVSNLGIIWRANKQGLDPDYGSSYPAPPAVAIGFSTNF